jgi:hypothetical protein
MKKKILEYLDQKIRELAYIRYDKKMSDRHRNMADGAWAELKIVYSFIEKMEE